LFLFVFPRASGPPARIARTGHTGGRCPPTSASGLFPIVPTIHSSIKRQKTCQKSGKQSKQSAERASSPRRPHPSHGARMSPAYSHIPSKNAGILETIPQTSKTYTGASLRSSATQRGDCFGKERLAMTNNNHPSPRAGRGRVRAPAALQLRSHRPGVLRERWKTHTGASATLSATRGATAPLPFREGAGGLGPVLEFPACIPKPC
jgi:hypothetical protein